ncbi:unnamed protein product [Closterium sp. NIES-54]
MSVSPLLLELSVLQSLWSLLLRWRTLRAAAAHAATAALCFAEQRCPAGAALPSPSRPPATTAAAAARATAAAGGGAAGSAGGASAQPHRAALLLILLLLLLLVLLPLLVEVRLGVLEVLLVLERSLPLPDDPTPQQLREWVIQRGSSGGGGFGFMWPQRPRDCASQRCVPGCVEAAALGSSEPAVAPGAGESATALGARESADALGASASTAIGLSSTKALHTFTLDSGASRCFFRDCTTITPLAAPVPLSPQGADPTGGPDEWVDTFIPGGHRVAICKCSQTGRHLATFTRQPGSSLYALTSASAKVAESGQVAASSQVSASCQLAASCSCQVISHQTLLWHHRLGHPSLPRLRSMHSRLIVTGLPWSLPSLPRSPALPCLPCVEGWQGAAPHSSEFPPTTGPLQTLHMDTCYTTVFPLRCKAVVSGVLIPWIRATRRHLHERFRRDFPVLCLHSVRGGEFSSDLLAEFCQDEDIRQTFTLSASPQQNGIAERRIGLIMEVARTSMNHAVAPHFRWPFAVQYAAHQLNLWPHVSEPETSPTLRWTGKVGDASVLWGPAPSVVSQLRGDDPAADDTAATRRSPRLETPPGFLPRPSSPPPQPATVDSGAKTAGAEPGGAETEGEGSGGATTGGAGFGGATTGGADSGGAVSRSGGGAVGDPAGGSPGGGGYGPAGAGAASPGGSAGVGGTGGTAGGAACAGGTRGAAGAGGARATSPRGATGAGGAGPTNLGGTTGARGVAGAGGAGTGGIGGAVAAGPGGARTGGAGAAGAGGAISAGGAGGTGVAGTGGASATGAGATRAVGPGGARTRATGVAGAGGAASAGGATGAAGTGGSGAAGTGGAGVAGTGGARTRGAGATGAGGAASAGGTAGAAGPGGARTRGAGATGAGGAVDAGGAGGATGAAGTGGAGGTAGARGDGVVGARGAAGVGGATGAAGAGGVGAAGAGGAGAAGAGGAGAAGIAPRRLFFYPQPESSLSPPDSVLRQLLLGSPLPALAPHTEVTESLTERCEPETRASTPIRARRVARPRPPAVPGNHGMALRPSSVPQHVVLPKPPASSLLHVPDRESDLTRAASPIVTRLLATVVTDPDLESTAAFALVIELVDFVARSRLDYVTSLVTESDSVCPPSGGAEPALSSNGDPDALDIPTKRSYTEAIAGEYSSQWKTGMDAEMASWKSTGTYVDEVPPPRANIVDGMWIFRVKRPLGSPPAFKARYVARGFTQRDYELHSLEFSIAFLLGSLHEEIWLRRPPGFIGSFPAGTHPSLRRPVYGLGQAPREWHNTLRTTLAALGFVPSSANLSLFLRTDTTMPPFYVLVYVDDLVFAIDDAEALALVKAELQERHTCTDLGELRSYLGLQINRDRAWRTITLTQSHMVHQVLQRFGFQFSSPQPTPLSTGQSLSAPPSDESVESSGPYPELVGCLITSGMGLVLGGRVSVVLTGHSDASWADDQATQRSSQGYTFSLGFEAILAYLLTDLGERPRSPPVLYVNNKAMLALCHEQRLDVSQLMAKGIHLEADSTTQEFKLYHGKGGLYIGKAVLKNNVFVLDFVPDLGTADSDGIVTFTSWTHPPDLDPDFSPEGFWYSHTIPEAESTRALATIQHSTAAETVSTEAETSATPTPLTIPVASSSTASPYIVDTPPTPAQQLTPTPREVHRSTNFTAAFYSNSDLYRRSPGHRASEDILHARMGHPSNTVLNNTIRAGVLDKDSLLLTDGSELRRARGTCFTCPEADLPHRPFTSHHNPSAPAYAPLEKVYSDILYNRKPGQGAYSYTITFIDAATRYVWHLNLPSKDMAFEAFIAWLPVAERESGERLKSFQSDGGGEYTSQRFKQFLAEKGIKRLVSLPYAHQQQGVAERLNRTLHNTMRKLLRGMRLPNHQWPEAMDHAVMLHNLLSSSSLPNNV